MICPAASAEARNLSPELKATAVTGRAWPSSLLATVLGGGRERSKRRTVPSSAPAATQVPSLNDSSGATTDDLLIGRDRITFDQRLGERRKNM